MYTAIALETRNPALPHAQFLIHWDEHFLPILQAAVGSAFPLTHSRYYVQQQQQQQDVANPDNGAVLDPSPAPRAPLMFMGQADRIDFDCLVVLVFADEAHFQEFKAALWDKREVLSPEQDKFLLRSELRVLATENARVVRNEERARHGG